MAAGKSISPNRPNPKTRQNRDIHPPSRFEAWHFYQVLQKRNCVKPHAIARTARDRPPIAFAHQAWSSGRGMDKNPGPIRALLEEGLAHQRAGRLEDALHCYARVLSVDPGNFPAL